MFKLALNAGHGKNTAGKRCLKKLDKKETREWVLNSRICEKIEEKLKAYTGYDVLRLDDPTGIKDIALKKRTDAANKYGADFYLSIHHNAGIKGGIGGGIETYVYTKAGAESKEWQEALYEALINHAGLKGNRSDGTRTKNLHECRESNMPCVLIECGFMDSKTDVPIILTSKFADEVAEACVEVIVKKAKLKKKSTKSEEPKKENKVLAWQKAAIKDGFKFPKYGADGDWGDECVAVAKKAICKKRLTYKYKNLTKLVQKAVGVAEDGKFGASTKKAVEKYQKLLGLTADGAVGLDTWKKILGVK
ncbi:MAG: N-acetylmuramoyl-L-alanine amidase [Clostridia bacterium]|nr:N-acetylmuramoyl-L-alanine amidase [Clostridia bacterium]